MAPADLLTAAEVAEFFQVSRPTISRWTKQGWLKPIRIGGGPKAKPLYRREDIERLLEPEAS